MKVIEITNLCKDYQRKVIKPGLGGHVQAFFSPQVTKIPAVMNCTLSVQAGERIAFLGPNGAGKSTVIKVLTGIIHRTSGDVKVLGLDPQKQQKQLSKKIGFVFGQRSQLQMHLPARDSLQLLGTMYDVSSAELDARIADLSKQLGVSELLGAPVRTLSLGQRIRFELMASMLHKPEILFLDEPTIGLDIVAKGAIVDLIKHCANEYGTTIFMTSHDPSDIEKLCDRSIIIDKGKLIIDESIAALKERYNVLKKLEVMTTEPYTFPTMSGVSVEYSNCKAEISVNTELVPMSEVLKTVASAPCIRDMQVVNKSIEDILNDIYSHN